MVVTISQVHFEGVEAHIHLVGNFDSFLQVIFLQKIG